MQSGRAVALALYRNLKLTVVGDVAPRYPPIAGASALKL
jgi:hypothetical protein